MKKLGVKENIKAIQKKLYQEVRIEREKVIVSKKSNSAKYYPTDIKKSWQGINNKSNIFINKNPKLINFS